MRQATTTETIGAALMGFVTATFEDLLPLLGEPVYADNSDDKVTTEWMLKSDDGIIFTIYDYDNTRGKCRNGQPYRWHIGGFNRDALRAIERVTRLEVTGR